MSDDLTNLYQQLILDHAKNPHGRVVLDSPTASSHQVNPNCGDEVTLSIEVRDGTLAAIGWQGHGCSISQSSASLLAQLLEGTTVTEAHALLEEFREAMRSRGTIELDEERFGDAIALNGVSRYVARVKCAMLPWVALEAALAA
ncbi:SUF system NifU family Fe-S cluster assembly protein [soil metagenome]